MLRRLISLALVLGLFAAPGCAEPETTNPADSEAALSDLDALLEGAPENGKLPDEAKSDQTFAVKFTDLVADQSAVKSQGGRGVCSIFSTVGLMESLYIKEGTITDPDFSEQFLQWSVKVELGRFKTTGGSNASANIDAIKKFGVVSEADEPYQSSGWNSTNDPECTGDDKPTKCFTNGEPSDNAKAATRWRLPNNRWVSSRPQNIKAYMMQNKTAVVAGMQFFYQSWNHRKSALTTNRDYWSEGYVLYPNAEDKADSAGDRRAGHSILIVGWDDELEVPVMDKDGKQVLDAEGNPEVEKGFWLFKNSWGTSGFGIRHESGAGYGWLSMKYVTEFGSVNSAGVPKLNLKETCGDGKDNDFDGVADCDDPQCSDHESCNVPVTEFESTERADIPDADAAGLTQTIDVPTEGFVATLTLNTDIEHSFTGDLVVSLSSPSGKTVELVKNQMSGLPTTFNVSEMVAEPVKGAWSLTVVDEAAKDEGRLNSWGLKFTITADPPTELCDDGIDNTGNGSIDCADAACSAADNCANSDGPWQGVNDTAATIPDNDPAGVTSSVTIDGNGAVNGLTVLVDIAHTYVGDLTVSLVHPDGTETVLQREEGGSADEIKQLFEVSAFNGKAVAGEWKLKVVDHYEADEGTINNWLLEIAE